MTEVSEQLIQKFFSNQCTAEEAMQVQQYFDSYPGELEKYISIQNLLNSDADNKLDAAISQKLLASIEKEIAKKETKVIRLNWLKYAVAASVVGIGLFIAVQYNRNNNEPKALANTEQQQVPLDSTVNTLKTTTNTTNKTMLIALEDGSTVKLLPKSSLQYLQPFSNHERQLFLKGTAFFKVAKDKTKPFVVTTEGISTTALGTSFTIEAEVQSNSIRVQLFTGKVMVSKAANSGYAFNTQYLKPGQQLLVNKATYAVELSTFIQEENKNKPAKPTIAVASRDRLNFIQAGLPEVFKALEKEYNITINYHASELANMTFTGKFEPDDDVAAILNNIALLNGLSVVKTDIGFEVKK